MSQSTMSLVTGQAYKLNTLNLSQEDFCKNMNNFFLLNLGFCAGTETLSRNNYFELKHEQLLGEIKFLQMAAYFW